MHLRKNDIRDIEVRDLPSSQQSGGFIMEYGLLKLVNPCLRKGKQTEGIVLSLSYSTQPSFIFSVLKSHL